MIEAFIDGWQRSFDYSGRSTRASFLWFMLADALVMIILFALGSAVEILTKIAAVFVFAQIFPSLALTIRRLRDTGKAWPWIFIQLVPVVGGIWFLVLVLQPSVPAI